MGDNMCSDKMITVHILGLMAIVSSFAYIYLNETGKLNKVKRQCMDKAMDIKEDIKEKLNTN